MTSVFSELKVKLIRLANTNDKPNALRSVEVVGWTYHAAPQEGRMFIMWSEPLDPKAAMRLVTTSPVRNVIQNALNSYDFETQNSLYRVIYYG